MTGERVNRALGRVAELLLESDARVGLNEIQELLEELDSDAYAAGFEDAERAADDRESEAAERAYERELGDWDHGN